jgi:hypothetical protein
MLLVPSAYSAYEWTYQPYTPLHAMDDILNVTKSGCSPPGTVSGCSSCRDGSWPELYQQDCIYYIGSRPSDCKTVYPQVNKQESCISFMFWEKSKSADDIIPTCNLMNSDQSVYGCIMALVPILGKAEMCEEIPKNDPLFLGYNQQCYKDFARRQKKPEECRNVISIDNAIDCCTAAKGVEEQYLTTRQDLVDSFINKYGAQLKECKTLLQIKPAAVVEKCEQLNCDCLSPCNKKMGEEQNRCAGECGTKYNECYDKEKTEMVPESKDRYWQQSFYGMFSRKHCSEYKNSVAAAIKADDHGPKDEPAECTSHDQCGQGRLCDGCGRCRDEKELVFATDVQITYKIEPDRDTIKLKNTITETGVFRVNVDSIIEAKGKRVDYCDVIYPGLNKSARLNAEFVDKEIFAGFTTGSLLDSRDTSQTCTLDLLEGSDKCVFIVSPNDRKKPVGLVKEIRERIRLYVTEDKGNGFGTSTDAIGNVEDALDLILMPTGPQIKFNMGNTQVQQGTTRAIKFTVEDPDTKMILVHVKAIGPGTLFMPKDGPNLDNRNLHFTMDPGEDIQVGFKSPVFSSFDLGKEMASLSMMDLQTEAGKQILTDAAFAAVDVGLDKVGGSVQQITATDDAALAAYKRYIKSNPGYRTADKTSQMVMNAGKAREFEAGVKLLTDEYKFGKGFINDLPGINSGIKDAQAAVGQNVNDAQNDANAPGYIETGANLGVTAITVAQLGVSVLTFIPNKLPGVGAMTAGFQVAFSAATNIWKANLKYIAQAEKIDRAEERFVPVVVFVTAEDMSGWQTSAAITMKEAFFQV